MIGAIGAASYYGETMWSILTIGILLFMSSAYIIINHAPDD